MITLTNANDFLTRFNDNCLSSDNFYDSAFDSVKWIIIKIETDER